jgi:hypothetical protein
MGFLLLVAVQGPCRAQTKFSGTRLRREEKEPSKNRGDSAAPVTFEHH